MGVKGRSDKLCMQITKVFGSSYFLLATLLHRCDQKIPNVSVINVVILLQYYYSLCLIVFMLNFIGHPCIAVECMCTLTLFLSVLHPFYFAQNEEEEEDKLLNGHLLEEKRNEHKTAFLLWLGRN